MLNVEFWICFFFVYRITAITYNCWYYNKSQHKIHFWTKHSFPFIFPFSLYKRLFFINMLLGEKDRKITPPFQVHRVSSVHHFFQQTRIWQMLFLLFHGTASCHWKHRGATSSAESGNKRSVSLEYLEYPLWKSKVFFGVKKETVFPQRSVGETPLCSRCSRTPMICSTPSEHFLSRLITLHLRQENIYIQLRRLKITVIITSLHDCLWTYVFCRSLMVKDWVVPQCAVSRREMHWLFSSSWVEFIRSLAEFNEM